MNVVVTGGAGFIGSSISEHFLSQGHHVIIIDNLQRPGSERNVKRLFKKYEKRIEFIQKSVQDLKSFAFLNKTDAVFHTSAQVAVTHSLTFPFNDFVSNCVSTLNLLEAVRQLQKKPFFFYLSTNKVYGTIKSALNRATPELCPLSFESPYACSKGTADCYVQVYANIYKIPAVVFRMSCIYGEHQYGNEDQGWVAHFIIRARLGQKITIYGDGKQVRDILHVQDLIRAFNLAMKNIHKTRGKVYNIGGGINNKTSLLQMLQRITELNHKTPEVTFKKERTGDQRFYVSDIQAAKRDFSWAPAISVKEGTKRIFKWVCKNEAVLRKIV